ncbi:MAG TPA: methyltransferase domain-containing protein [Pseudonocardiaceae bacterium]
MTSPDAVPALPLTGERTVPGVPEENYWFRRHEAVYEAVLRRCVDSAGSADSVGGAHTPDSAHSAHSAHRAGATVLEAGCGEGYGADLLAGVASTVIALDYDEATVAHVRRRYSVVEVLRGNLAALPIRSGSIDMVVNLQVIEHLWDQPRFLAECLRVLRPAGTLVVSTPNRITFSPGRDTPLNPFHTRELAAGELADLLREAGFTVDRLAGLHHGPRLAELDAAHGGSLIGAQERVVLGHLPGQAIWPADLLADVVSVRANDFVIRDENVDDSLDLVAVATKPVARSDEPAGGGHV